VLDRRVSSAALLTFAATLAAAVALALYVIKPFAAGGVDFDSAASVLFFQRLAGGRHLEAWVGATPKPLMTVVLGGLHAIWADWRLIIWASIAAYAVAVALSAVLARRLAGSGAAAFTAVALLGATPLLLDVARGYSIAWAMLGWVVAGLAISAKRPRYALAALALGLAALARVETFVLIGAATAALLAWGVRARSGRGTPPPRAASWILASWLALPIMLGHDWLLTGDPFFWLRVSARFSEAAADAVARQGPANIAAYLVRHVLRFGGFAILAALGVALAVSTRRWGVALGVAAATVGVAGFLVLLAARGTYVSTRYVVPIDIVILFAAGLGFGSLRTSSLARFRVLGGRRIPATPHSMPWGTAGIVAIAAVSAAVLWVPLGSEIKSDTGQVRALLGNAVRADRVVPIVRHALENVAGGSGEPDSSKVLAPADLDRIILVVPSSLRPRLAVDANVGLTRIAGLGLPSFGTVESLVHRPGRVIVHDPRTEGAAAGAYAALETQNPVIDGVHLIPLLVDPVERIWVYQVP
jgi:hypothetical protein